MKTPSPWHRDPDDPLEYYLLLADSSGANVLLMPDDNTWSLPHFTPDYPDFRIVHHIQEFIRTRVGIEAVVLRCVDQHHNPDHHQWDRFYALDYLDASSDGLVETLWADHDDLDVIQLSHPGHRDLIKRWLDENKQDDRDPTRSPWIQQGWHQEATDWILGQLDELQLHAITPVRQDRVWAISALLTIETEGGTLYFKAVPPFMAQESVATLELSKQYPDLILTPLATKPERGWLLMPDIGGVSLTTRPALHQWEEALRQWSEVQVQQADQVSSWLQRGCPDRRLNRMVALIDPLITVSTQTLTGRPHSLSEAEVEGLLALSMKLKLLCANLANYRVPQTLVHGDLSGNIHVNEDRFTIFDWTDVCIAHPFFDMAPIIETVFDNSVIQAQEDVRSRLRNAYLEPWTAYEPMERLIEAFELSTSLGALHQAMSYMWILMNISEDTRWELESGLLLWLRRLLHLLPPHVY